MRIKTQLTLFIVLMIGLVGGMTWIGLSTFRALGQSVEAQRKTTQALHDALDAESRASLAFKTAVQEWKNVLIRGHDAEARAKYAKALKESSQEVVKSLGEIEALGPAIGLDATLVPPVRTGLNDLLAAYDAAQAAWKVGDDLAYRAADGALKGKDRPVAKAMEALRKGINDLADAGQARTVAEAQAAETDGERHLIGFAIGTALVAILVGTAFSLLLRRPLERLRQTLVRLAAHDFHHPVSDQSRRDEIGEMASALEQLRRGLEAEHEVTLALQARIAELTRAAEGLAQTGSTLTQAAGTSSTRAAGVVQASRETSESVSSAAAAAEEMSASIQEISVSSGQAVDMVQKAMANGQEATAAMAEMVRANEAINQVAKSIADIAARTNLLALNASIEAASAGDAGRGFAVVAGEVKDLARQTATSTQDISTRIDGVRHSVQQVEGAIARMTQAIEGISGIQQSIAGSLQAQSAVTSDIGHTIITVSTRSQAIADAIAEVSSSAATTEQNAQVTSAAAQELTRLAGEFGSLAKRLERSAA